jgi:sulfate adenylyltransferase subunit 1 (EFTu-like GTPase family)
MSALEAVPVSALHGDNVVHRSATLDWYHGPTLLELLESIDAHDDEIASAPLRFAVQYVDKSDAVAANEAGSRRYLGRIGSGTVNVGQAVQILPAGTTARVAAIETFDGALPSAFAGQSVALRLDREVDLSRGDWLAEAGGRLPQLTRLMRADLAWLDNEALAPQRRLWLRHGTRLAGASTSGRVGARPRVGAWSDGTGRAAPTTSRAW